MATGYSGIDRRVFLKSGIALGAYSSISSQMQATSKIATADDRQYWVEVATRVSSPVLRALSERKLKATMPVEGPLAEERKYCTYLEALGRTLTGLAPWLESGAGSGTEGKLRQEYAELARKAIEAGTDPGSPDFLNFNKGRQPLVDTAFLSLAILRAPTELWQKLDKNTQHNVIEALQSSRAILPGFNNWLLFSAMVEAALSFMGAWWDPMRVDYAIRSADSWYKGDGVYGDGPDFHWDYYNSFVIQPMLLNILDVISKSVSTWKHYQPVMLARARRYAEILERLISPEGTFPPLVDPYAIASARFSFCRKYRSGNSFRRVLRRHKCVAL